MTLRKAVYITCIICSEDFYVCVVNPSSQTPVCSKCFFTMRMFKKLYDIMLVLQSGGFLSG